MINPELHPTFNSIMKQVCSNYKTIKKVVHRFSNFHGDIELHEFDGHGVTIGIHFVRNCVHILLIENSISEIEADKKLLKDRKIVPYMIYEIKWGVKEKWISMSTGSGGKHFFYDTRDKNFKLSKFLFDRNIELQKLLYSVI